MEALVGRLGLPPPRAALAALLAMTPKSCAEFGQRCRACPGLPVPPIAADLLAGRQRILQLETGAPALPHTPSDVHADAYIFDYIVFVRGLGIKEVFKFWNALENLLNTTQDPHTLTRPFQQDCKARLKSQGQDSTWRSLALP